MATNQLKTTKNKTTTVTRQKKKTFIKRIAIPKINNLNRLVPLTITQSHSFLYGLSYWQTLQLDRIKKFLLDKNYKKKSLLDITPSTGYIGIEMARMGIDVTLCSQSARTIRSLEKQKKDLMLENMNILRCGIEGLPFKDDSFDYIVANGVLEYATDEKRVAREWKRLLKKDGRLFITVPLRFKYIWPFLWPINYYYNKKMKYQKRYDLETLKETFRLKTYKFFYTGHPSRFIGLFLSKALHNRSLESYFEKKDKKSQYKKYGANYLTVIFNNSMTGGVSDG